MMKRQIVLIDEELCNGCGLCVTPCAEGAIEIVDGKARVISDELCDGAGFCLAVCPTGALSIEEREVVPFNEAAAERKMHERGKTYLAQTCFQCGAFAPAGFAIRLLDYKSSRSKPGSYLLVSPC
jgi:NAD-dependent dihydropyrimidine dehydrogenase PreA subunit